MTEWSPEGALKRIGDLIMAALGGALAWLTAGWAGNIGSVLATLLAIAGAICGLVFSIMYRRYVGVLGSGAKRKGSLERNSYDALRDSLEAGGLPNRLYARRLTAFLDAVDRFFGDAGMADRTLFPHAFGLKTPAPLWTAPAFDRCLLLALIYPIATIFVIWAVSGHVGPAEAALGLKANFAGWQRGIAVAVAALSVFALRLFTRRPHRISLLFLGGGIAGAIVGAAGYIATMIGSGAVALAIFVGVITTIGTVVRSWVGGVSVALVVALTVIGAISIAELSDVIALASMGFFLVFVVFAEFIGPKIGHRWHGAILSLFFAAIILTTLGAANFLSALTTWKVFGPSLMFLGLLTLLNAPFDWASLGLTRALLRRGLELGGWWPFVLALADALLAALVIALLSLTMVIGVQAFDDLASHGGGERVLPLGPLFDGIAAHPTAPEYWWLYALLFSTMIPSLINLMIGGASLTRGVPRVPYLLLRRMPVGKAVPTFDRTWIALVLALQWVGGVILGLFVQAVAVVIVIGYVMPWLGLGLLDMARDVAALDLPARVGRVIAGIL